MHRADYQWLLSLLFPIYLPPNGACRRLVAHPLQRLVSVPLIRRRPARPATLLTSLLQSSPTLRTATAQLTSRIIPANPRQMQAANHAQIGVAQRLRIMFHCVSFKKTPMSLPKQQMEAGEENLKQTEEADF
jgi:hypothetical protein